MREDLLALNEAALLSLSNRGLLKRAATMVPDVVIEMSDETIIGHQSDGNTCELPPDTALKDARCTCGAQGVCRHGLATVLAYQALSQAQSAKNVTDGGTSPADDVPGETGPVSQSKEPSSPLPVWSPGEFSDDDLQTEFGGRALQGAKRMIAPGLTASLHRGPQPSVDLPSATVRFLVPHSLKFATVEGDDPRLVIVAVWLFREADRAGGDEPAEPRPDTSTVQIGGTTSRGFPGVLAALDELLRDGVVHSMDLPWASALRQVDSMQWAKDALTDLIEQITAYKERRASYDPQLVASLVAELYARHRAAVSGRAPVPWVLGTQVAPETPCNHVRLVGLGATVHVLPHPTDEDWAWQADVYLADPESGIVSVIRHSWDAALDASLTRRRVSGVPLTQLAAGQIVTQSAYRLANRELRLATSRVAPTTVLPAGSDWSELPPGLLVRDFAEESSRLADLPPRMIRQRVRAENIRVLSVAEVSDIVYRSGSQRVMATLHDELGNTAHLVYDYNPAAPDGLDLLIRTLKTEGIWVAGEARRHTTLRVRPTAVLAGPTTVVPDLAQSTDHEAISTSTPSPDDAIDQVLDQGLTALASLAHAGLTHRWSGLSEAADDLARVGMRQSAEALRRITQRSTVDNWVDAQLRLSMAAELR